MRNQPAWRRRIAYPATKNHCRRVPPGPTTAFLRTPLLRVLIAPRLPRASPAAPPSPHPRTRAARPPAPLPPRPPLAAPLRRRLATKRASRLNVRHTRHARTLRHPSYRTTLALAQPATLISTAMFRASQPTCQAPAAQHTSMRASRRPCPPRDRSRLQPRPPHPPTPKKNKIVVCVEPTPPQTCRPRTPRSRPLRARKLARAPPARSPPAAGSRSRRQHERGRRRRR